MVAKLVILLAVVSAARGADYYETLDNEYDGSGSSAEEFAALLDCLSDAGPCTALGADYRQHYPEVIIQECARCRTIQKRAMCGIFKRAREEFPERYQVLKVKYDPEGIYFDKFIVSLLTC